MSEAVASIGHGGDYALCGWRFRSELPIAALPAWDGDAAHPVDIDLTLGAVAPVPCDELVGVFVSADGSATVMSGDAGRFAVRDGRTIVADVRAGALPGAVETMVLGPVLGTISYQRGVLPLHSNTIVIDGKAVAMSGRSGAGKSTLAAILLKRGHRLISDDVLPLRIVDGQTFGLPGSQHLRLWGETLDLLGEDKQGLRRAADGVREKYYLPSHQKTTAPWPLVALIWLESGFAEQQLLRPNHGALRTRTIFKAAYRQHLAREFVASGSKAVADLSLPGVDVYDFWRPRDLALLQEQATMIENATLGFASSIEERQAARR